MGYVLTSPRKIWNIPTSDPRPPWARDSHPSTCPYCKTQKREDHNWSRCANCGATIAMEKP